MGITSIEWTDRTWNPVRGCSVVSEGCRNCYAKDVAARFSGPGQAYEGLARRTKSGSRWTGKVQIVEKHLTDPLRWRDPQRVFANSMSDLFHEALSDESIDRVFAVMALSSHHTFQVLTKRARRMLEYFASKKDTPLAACTEARVARQAEWIARDRGEDVDAPNWDVWWTWPLPNVHLGVSTEDQATADERIPLLLQTPAAVRFISAEPLLGPLTLVEWLVPDMRVSWGDTSLPPGDRQVQPTPKDMRAVSALGRAAAKMHGRAFLDWVIVGGESGPGARPMHIAWARNLVEQCQHLGVPVFMKQLGAMPALLEKDWRETVATGRTPILSATKSMRRDVRDAGLVIVSLADRKGGDPGEWPEDLRVRQFPGDVPSSP